MSHRVLLSAATFAAFLSLTPAARSAPPSLVVNPDSAVPLTRGASVQSLRIASDVLKQSREIFVVLPASFSRSAPERRYPVLIVLDGEDTVPSAAAVASELARNGQIPECLIVAIPNRPGKTDEESMQNRVFDLTPPGLSVSGSDRRQGGDRFLDFIERELLPAVDRQYRGGLPRILVGHSSGGVLATYVAATRPGFRAVLALDTPTWFADEWLPRQLQARAVGGATIPLRYASYEVRFGWRDSTWQALVASAPSTWRLHREHLAAESHESLGMLGMYLGLRELFSDYSILAAPVAPTTRILAHYDTVGASLGARLVPPRKLLRQVAEDLLMEGRGAEARVAYRTWVTGYGAPPDSAELEAQIAEVERQPPPKETVEGLLATPFSSPEEARPYLGEWVGDEWMNPDEPRPGNITLRLRVEQGRVVGETVYHMPGSELVIPWQYLRVTPKGMTWGYMNGMRPRGMLMYESTLAGNVLTGESHFGGIIVRPARPHIGFSFRRVRT